MTKRVPLLGIIGDVALREAAAGSYQQLLELLNEALRRKRGEGHPCYYIQALFPDAFVISCGSKLVRYTYTIDAEQVVTLTETGDVEETYQPKGTTSPASKGSFVEAVAGDDNKGRYSVRVIRSGASGNNNYYPDTVLREALPLFDGARVFVKADEEHIQGKGKDVRNLIGRLSEPRFVEGKTTDTGEVLAVLSLIEPEGTIGVKLREAATRGMLSLFGLSIDARGEAKKITRGGNKFVEATKVTRVASVDLIVEPGAGGGIISFIEAQEERQVMNRDELIALIEAKRPDLLRGKNAEELSEAQLKAIFTEAMSAPAATTGVTREELLSTTALVEARGYARATINASKLPDAAKTKLLDRFKTETKFVEADVDGAIKAEAEYLANFTESGKVTDLGTGRFVEAGESRPEKIAAMLDAFFDKESKDHKHAGSFRECYIEMTGDKNVTGLRANCDERTLRESLGSADFDDVLGSAITRRMVADYRRPSQYEAWRRIATVTRVNDFRTQERTRFGGYGDLPIVEQKDPYGALASPTDEKSTYAVKKRGGTEDVTLEMIKNDDVGAIQRIPIALSRSAKRTLGKFVFDFIRTNPTVYDSVALFHATHGNLGSAALDRAALAAGRVAMLKQAEKDSADPLGIGPRTLMVAADGEEGAVNLFRQTTENEKTFIQSLVLDIIPVWYWTDANDWALAADPLDIPGIEIGFLDGNEEPELFVQDDPRGGSMFSHDKLTWKIRHVYGGNVTDFRAFYKAVVA